MLLPHSKWNLTNSNSALNEWRLCTLIQGSWNTGKLNLLSAYICMSIHTVLFWFVFFIYIYKKAWLWRLATFYQEETQSLTKLTSASMRKGPTQLSKYFRMHSEATSTRARTFVSLGNSLCRCCLSLENTHATRPLVCGRLPRVR